ncbi:hypothetical protein [Candidatus Nitrosotenuis aquarius]|uniref:hypothetical protein n=1 Tax=Candidatus Nitrosotenuis aquarius TaxID=1846278 RepID=UPI000C1E994C|nr:hypothetical protein [Candidatus Nitrosotenuis aquarius]
MKLFEDYEDIFHRALDHYEDKLRMVSKEDGLESLVSNDLNKNADDVKELRENLARYDDTDLTEWARKNLCLALTYYVDYLKKSIEETRTNLNDLNLEFKQTQKEIDLADEAKKKYCPAGWNTKN